MTATHVIICAGWLQSTGRFLLGVVWFGAADAADSSLNPVQHLALDEYTACLATIVSALRSAEAESVVSDGEF